LKISTCSDDKKQETISAPSADMICERPFSCRVL